MTAKERSSTPPRASASAGALTSTCRERPPGGSPTGVEAAVLRRHEGLLLPSGPGAGQRLPACVRPQFCLEGSYYRAGDAVNYAIGQGDTLVTPLQLARAYAALANGGTLFEPRVGKAIVSPDGAVLRRIKPQVTGHVPVTAAPSATSTRRCSGPPRSGRWPGG
ncbi:MAG: penicillin-binding transpeptidase domain-containing protein [Nocardioides sp.]